nr:9946_t:CDS:1 [Entrophospora candida]
MFLSIKNTTKSFIIKPFFTSLSSSKIITTCQRHYSARKPVKQVELSAPVYEEIKLDDGSVFVSRAPPSPIPLLLPSEQPQQNLQTNDDNKNIITMDKLPPPLKKIQKKKYHLTDTDINSIKELRQKDPDKWTRSKLAKKFNCSQMYIGIVAPTTEERKARLKEQLMEQYSKMGYKKKFIKEERLRRRDMW